MKRYTGIGQFAPLLVATIGLPGRGKSLLARRLCRYLNFTGDVSKGRKNFQEKTSLSETVLSPLSLKLL